MTAAAHLLLLLFASLLLRPTALRTSHLYAASGQRVPDLDDLRDWMSLNNCQVLFPSSSAALPQSIVHFTGGFLLGTASPVAYNDLFQQLSQSGHVIVATPIPPLDSNHGQVAAEIAKNFNECYYSSLLPMLGPLGSKVPVVGLSHSLGGKLTALLSSNRQNRRKSPQRAGNIFMAFNNYGFRQSLSLSAQGAAQANPGVSEWASKAGPGIRAVGEAFQALGVKASGGGGSALDALGGLFDSLGAGAGAGAGGTGGGGGVGGTGGSMSSFVDAARRYISKEELDAAAEAAGEAARAAAGAAKAALDFEFTPSPAETWDAILSGYGVDNNVLLQFEEDTIDESVALQERLLRRGGCTVRLLRLPGDHLAPCGGDKVVLRAVGACVSRLAGEWNDKRGNSDLLGGRMLGAGS